MRYNVRVGTNIHEGGTIMIEREAVTEWEARFEEAEREIANMDEFDYYNLLMESRIIEAS